MHSSSKQPCLTINIKLMLNYLHQFTDFIKYMYSYNIIFTRCILHTYTNIEIKEHFVETLLIVVLTFDLSFIFTKY